jgi:hypothetical protein
MTTPSNSDIIEDESMNRRESLVALGSAVGGLGAVSLSGCAVAQPADARMIVDDGVTAITPVYVMTYTNGRPTVFVRADYYFMDAKKQVQLRSDGSIKVNGIQLQRDPNELISYIGDIPVAELLTFEFTRTTGQVMRHSFALPELDIRELPKQYAGIDPIHAVVSAGPARKGVREDKFAMTIFGRKGETRFKGELKNKSELTFRSVQYSASPPGSYRADIYRQQRTALQDISDQKSGWAVASRGHNFVIEVP